MTWGASSWAQGAWAQGQESQHVGSDADNRLSAFNFCDPFDHILPFADGTINVTDRAHLWGMYSGIAIVDAALRRNTRTRQLYRQVGGQI